MYEIVINGQTRAVVDNRIQATAIFDFYRKEKRLFNITELALVDVNNSKVLRG